MTIKQYYDELIKVDGMPDFEDLEPDFIDYMESSVGYQFFKLRCSMDDFSKVIRKEVDNIFYDRSKGD